MSDGCAVPPSPLAPVRLRLPAWLVASLVGCGAWCAAAADPWFSRVLVGMEVGPTGAHFGSSDPHDARYAARFDGREIVRRCADAAADYLVIWARDGDYAYYDSRVLPKPPGLGDRDPLREAVAEADRLGMPIVAYCVVQQAGHFLAAHPEWEMRAADGRPIGRFCLNSGYREALEAILDEQLAYGIDGFHLDMLDQGFGPPIGCWCDACRSAWRADHGDAPMPDGPTWDDAWDRMLEFRYRTSERFEQALAAHVRTVAPAATVDFNYHGNPPFSWEVGQRPVQHAGNGDFVTGETGVWGFSALGVGLNAEFYRASTPGRPFQVVMQRGVRMYHDQTTRPLEDIRWELMTLLAHGGFVTMVDKTGFDGGLDPTAYERTGRAFTDAKRLRATFGHAPVRQVGLYYSSRSRDWMGRDAPGAWMQSFLGAHKALAYEHLPWGVLLDENASLERLREFPVVVLCNAGILGPAEIARLEEYVRGGGGLVATGFTGRLDRLGRSAASPAWDALSGAALDRRLESLDNWVLLPAEDAVRLGADLPAAKPFLVHGPGSVLVPTTAEPLGRLLAPHRTSRQRDGREATEWPMSADAPVGPALVVNRVGRGRVVTLACGPDHAVGGEYHVQEARRLLAGAVRMLLPPGGLRIDAPTTVQAVPTREAGRDVMHVHLLAYASAPQSMPARDRPRVLPALLEDVPRYRARIEFERPPVSVSAAHETTRIRTEGRVVELEVEGVHEVVTAGW